MFSIQEREEADFQPMSMADEARWQHAQGSTCSFDCAACDPATPEEDWDWVLQQMTVAEIEDLCQDEFDTAARWTAQEYAPNPWF